MKYFIFTLIVVVALAIGIYFLQPAQKVSPNFCTPTPSRATLLKEIALYEQAYKAKCPAEDWACMSNALAETSGLNAYVEWINYDANCKSGPDGPCTLMAIIPSPQNMRDSLERYLKFCHAL